MREEPKISTETLDPFIGKFIRLGVPNFFHSEGQPFYYYGKILSKDDSFLTFEHYNNGRIQMIPINTILDVSTVLPNDRRRKQ